MPEVMSETRLHEGPSRLVERLAGRPQYFVDDGWRHGLSEIAGPYARHPQAFRLLHLLRLTIRAAPRAGTLPLQRRLGQPHHPFGYTVCFLFEDVTGSAYRQFRLNSQRFIHGMRMNRNTGEIEGAPGR